jgi:hypothetical protein
VKEPPRLCHREVNQREVCGALVFMVCGVVGIQFEGRRFHVEHFNFHGMWYPLVEKLR